MQDVPAWSLAAAAIPGILAVALAAWALFALRRLRRAVAEPLADGTRADLEGLRDQVGAIDARLTDLDGRVVSHASETDERLRASVRFQGLIRYDAYTDMGGEQSWSIALLDEHQNGTVITSLHARDHARIYLKQISAGQPEQRLSPEEERAIALALGTESGS